MSSSSTSIWPPQSGLSTPSVHRSAAILSVSASTIINAPALLVWSILLDTSHWPEWNTFVPRVEIESQPTTDTASSSQIQKDTLMTFDVIMDPSKAQKVTPTRLRVIDISTPDHHSSYVSQKLLTEIDGCFIQDLNRIYRVSWKPEGGYASIGLASERVHEIIILDGERCELRTWECFSGILAHTIKWLYTKTLQDRFADWCRDLKCQSEKAFNKSGSM